ncbi:ATP-dependent Clp protease protease subunit [Neolewinella xylanilytica]|uniref:ATP-dependent Clp protease proteolytic subunit n=1 Tax=Neolewinella xylanilytica TaxID=1514080 RepID=A0A2S6I7U9_9BACT|nr:ATP-dependent Clp protease proteolytic subunit [Neolewinella xylanilytica]PPK87586.1 ATP-dependent Clp protease protease subunit [Neolewinella xylanilytica]
MHDFLRYAALDHGLDPAGTYRSLLASINPTIIEERQLNVAQLDVFSRLMMDRIIFLGTEINDYVANVIQAQLLFLASSDPGRDITLYINSPGGSVTAGLGIYDTMRHVPCSVNTTCTSLAASMASVLLCAGAPGKRTALPHSRVMIHQPSGGMQGKVSDMEINYRLMLELQDELYTIMSEHTHRTKEEIRRDADRDHWMTAEFALEYGFIDEVMTGAKHG